MVLFADICGFTKSSEDRDPGEVASELCALISKIDSMAPKYNLGRIKTIGDCVLVVSKLFTSSTLHSKCHNALQFAEQLIIRNEYWFQRLPWKVSISAGPIASAMLSEEVASIDIWGSTVNRAARLMQLAGTANRVVVDSGVYGELIGSGGLGRFISSTVEVDAKGVGKLTCYQLSPNGVP